MFSSHSSSCSCGCNSQSKRIFESPQSIVLQKGDNGWVPVLANVIDGLRVVQQVVDFEGGTGEKPTEDIGKYVGSTGLVTDISQAINIRGAQGLPGSLPTPSDQSFIII